MKVALGTSERVLYPLWPTTQPERKDRGGKEGVKFGLVVEIERQEMDGAPLVVLRSPLQVGLCWYHTWMWLIPIPVHTSVPLLILHTNCAVVGLGVALRLQMYVCKSDLSVLVLTCSTKGEGREERWGGREVGEKLSFFSCHLSLLQEEPGNMVEICC